MAARLLRPAIKRANSIGAMMRYPILTWSPSVSAYNRGEHVMLTSRLLHTKTLDKETNWNAQRMVNRHNLEEPSFNMPAQKENTANARSDTTRLPTSVGHVENEENFDSQSSDADVFGGGKSHEIEDEGDIKEENYLSNPPARSKRLPQIKYIRMIKEQLIAKQLKDAIDIAEKRMKEDRVKPESYTYNLLISGCAKHGYTRKAFSLFNRMRQRGLKVTGGTYTSLFNACANAPSAADGLNRANHLREIMLEKGVEANVKNYNAMIKAYGRWGDVKTAYQLADEMKEKNMQPTAETFNFLLQACASDTKYGFRHCLLTWHKMLKCGFKPDFYSFNTVLRCVRDCGFGDLETMEKVLREIVVERRQIMQIGNANANEKLLKMADESEITESETKSFQSLPPTNNPFKSVDPTNDNVSSKLRSACNPFKDSNDNQSLKEQKSTALKVIEKPTSSEDAAGLEVPNLLLQEPHLGSMLSLSEVTRPHERFLLLGGLIGFLDLMKEYKITPNIQMFTMLLEVIAPTNSAEKQVISFIRRIGLKADIDFFNVLIKKRSMRFDYDGAKEVLSMINTAGLHPDIVTYGVLALGCRTQEEARELLEEMRNKDIRMNIQILGAMLRQGCAQRSFPYICEIMQISLDEQVKPNDIFLRHLNDFYTRCARSIDARHPSTKTKNFKKQHARFCDRLRLYYEEHGIAGLKLADAIRVIKEGPYKQYKEAKMEGLESEKNSSLAQKQKIRKYIKKIKIANLKGDDDIEQECIDERSTIQSTTETPSKSLHP